MAFDYSDKMGLGGLLPAGVALPFAGSTAPNGWLTCDGSAVSRITYARLFAAIGTTHGTGNGTTTFNLPDYRGMFLRGAGSQTFTGQGEGSSTSVAGGTVGQKYKDKTKANGLSVSGGSYSLSGSAPGLGGSTQFGAYNHGHSMNASPGWTVQSGSGVQIADVHTHSNGAPGVLASVSISGGSYSLSGSAASLGAGDGETRPSHSVVNYIIKI